MSGANSRSAASSALVTLAGQACKLVLLLINLIVLGRLLTPAEYGVVAVATALIGVAELLRDFGLSAAAIQARELSDKQQSNLFWASVVLGFLLMGLSCIIAYPMQVALNISGLAGVLCGLGVVFLLNAIQTQFQVRLSRDNRFGAVAGTDVIGQLVGLVVGCVLALWGAGAWALVGLQVSASLIVLILRAVMARWVPGLVDRSVSIRSFIRFGANLGLAQILSYVVNALPSILIGKFGGVVQAGEFGRAYQIYSLPMNQVMSPLTNVVLANFTRRTDPDAYRKFSMAVLRAVGFIGAFSGSVLFVFSSEIIELLLGGQWAGAGDILRIIAIGIPAQALSLVYFWNFVSLGKTASLLRYNLVTKLCLVCALFVSAFAGTFAILVVLVVGLWASWLVCGWWFRSETMIDSSAVYSVGVRVAVVSLVSGCFGFQMKLYFEFLVSGPLVVFLSAGSYLVAFGLVASLLNLCGPVVYLSRRGFEKITSSRSLVRSS